MEEKNNRPQIVYVPVKDLKLNPNNPRKNDESVPTVILSIQKYGFKNPLICNTDYVVYCGNTRLKAARKLKLKEVPCIVADDLSPEEIREFAIVDNKSNEIAEWDDELLKAELEELEGIKDFDFDFELGGGSGLEIKTEAVEDEPPEVDEENEPLTKSGDLWILGKHRLICGDCTDKEVISCLTEGESVDLLLTDPPYNVGYVGKTKDALTMKNDKQNPDEFYNFLLKAFTASSEVMKAGAAFYVWFASRNHVTVENALTAADMPVREELIWVKNSLVQGRQDYQWRHEPCLYGWKDGAAHLWNSDRKQTTVIECNKPVRNGEHPTIKPVTLFHYLIQNSTKSGNKVLDTFGGSGTTLISCEQNNRVCYMVEIEPKYCDVIVKRYITFTGNDNGVFLLRNGERMSYAEAVKRHGAGK